MVKKLTVTMVGEDVNESGAFDINIEEDDLLHRSSWPIEVRMSCGVSAIAAGMEYELGNFVVNVGGHFVKGVYPYFTAEGWMDCSDYEKFYFGGLLLKLDDVWYLADWVDPDGNRYEMVTFEEMANLEAAFTAALKMAMADYVKKTA